MSLPKALQYPSLKQNAVASISTSYTCTPVNSSSPHAPGSLVAFDIPAGIRSQYLDPAKTFIKFSVQVALTGGTSPLWSALGYQLIRSLSLYSSAGSKLIESTDQYDLVHNILRDVYSDEGNVSTADSILLSANQSGDSLRTATFQAASVTKTFAIPLLSLLGLISAAEHYLPLHALSAPLRLELQLNSAGQALECTGAPTAVNYSLIAPELHLSLITISDVAQAQISQMTGGQYSWSSTIYRTFRNVHPAQQTIANLMIPARFSSVKSVFTAIRPSISQENYNLFSVSDHIRNYLQTFQMKYGSAYVSAKPIQCTGSAVEAYMELRSNLGPLITSEDCPGLISLKNWARDAGTNMSVTADPGSFLISSCLEPFSNQAALLSGLNSTGSQLFLELNFDPQQAANILACNIDSVVVADSVCTIQNGELSVAF